MLMESRDLLNVTISVLNPNISNKVERKEIRNEMTSGNSCRRVENMESAYICEGSATPFLIAHIGFLAGMHSGVDDQIAVSGKTL
jgi:hypothetical protein